LPSSPVGRRIDGGGGRPPTRPPVATNSGRSAFAARKVHDGHLATYISTLAAGDGASLAVLDVVFSHSAAQSSQARALTLQISGTSAAERLRKLAQVQQMSAQSMHVLAHSGLPSSMHFVPQRSHSTAQRIHASMQVW
jgi:succinyl-CoA synthetase beta subunit